MSQTSKTDFHLLPELVAADDVHAVCPFLIVIGLKAAVNTEIVRARKSPVHLSKDAKAIARAIRQRMNSYIASANRGPCRVRLKKYCKDLGLNYNTEKKRAQQHRLPGSFKYEGAWYMVIRPASARA